MMEIIPKPVLVRPVRNVKRPDAKIRQQKHLLPDRAEPKGKNPALLFSGYAQHQKRKYHTGKGIEEASGHVPDHIFFFQAQPCFHEKVRPVFHDYFLPFPFTGFLLRKFWISKIESSIRAI